MAIRGRKWAERLDVVKKTTFSAEMSMAFSAQCFKINSGAGSVHSWRGQLSRMRRRKKLKISLYD